MLQACRNSSDPQTSFNRIQQAFLHGDLTHARADAHRSYEKFSRDPTWGWKFKLLEAEIMTDQGLSQDVLALLDSELPPDLDPGDLGMQRRMFRALAFSHLGNFAKADENLNEALRRCPDWQCESAGKLARIGGAVEVDQTHVSRAEDYFRTSMRIAGEKKDQFLETSAFLNLAVISIMKEHFDESITWSKKAKASAESTGSGLDEEKALGNLGWGYYKMGDFERALEVFPDAARRAHDVGAVKDEAIFLNDLGMVNFQINRLPEAEDYYRKSFDLASKTQNSERMLDSLNALAFLSVKTVRLNDAKRYSKDAFELAHRMGDRADELYALLTQGEIAAEEEPETAQQHLEEVAQDPNSDTSLRWEARNCLAQMYEKMRRFDIADSQYRQAIGIVENARSTIEHEDLRLPFLANAAHLYDDYIHFLVTQGKSQQALQEADYSRAQTLAEGLHLGSRGTSKANLQRIAKDRNATILFYWIGFRYSYLWAISPTQTALVGLPATSQIDPILERYRKALVSPRDPLESGNTDGQILYQTLVRPVEKLIKPSSRVIIIPDGNLNGLNFETLMVSTPKPHYWIEDVTVQEASSVRLLANSRPARTRTGKLLLIGDPVAFSAEYGKLANASAEMDRIATHFGVSQRQVYAQGQATAGSYLDAHPEQFAYVHFVAHGTASNLSPLDSAVILSRTSDDNSAKLYARDIINHQLNAELVTISSCYGSGTRYYNGEGMIGLSWAFLRAGAHNVIGALWEVSDTSTPALMDDFYSQLKDGKKPDAALRSAKLNLLRSDSVYRKPFYWAPFQIYTGA